MANIEKTNRTCIIGTLNFSKDFKRAIELIKSESFIDYDTDNYEPQWFGLFFDEKDRRWSVDTYRNKFYLFIDDEPVISLGKLQKHIFNFIDEINNPKDIETEEYQQYREEQFRHYGYGRI